VRPPVSAVIATPPTVERAYPWLLLGVVGVAPLAVAVVVTIAEANALDRLDTFLDVARLFGLALE